jgi:hypothetical protein
MRASGGNDPAGLIDIRCRRDAASMAGGAMLLEQSRSILFICPFDHIIGEDIDLRGGEYILPGWHGNMLPSLDDGLA